MDQRPRLIGDPDLAATTFVVIDFEATTPTGARPEPIDVAAIQIRRTAGTWVEVGRFASLMCPPPHAPITPFDTAQTGITPAMVADALPAAVVLADLDTRLRDDTPHLLVAHNAHTEAGLIHDHRCSCIRLARVDLLDTVRMARAVYPQLGSHTLDTLIHHLGLRIPPGRHRALPDVEITVAVFTRLLADADTAGLWPTLAALRRAAGITAKANRPQQDSLFDIVEEGGRSQ